MANEFRIGGGLQNLPGAVPKEEHVLEQNNVERKTNDEMWRRRRMGEFQKFPMHVYKAGGLVRDNIQNEDELEAAKAQGWQEAADFFAKAADEPTGPLPDHVNRMTVKQAEAFVAEHAQDGAKLAEMLRDEQAHGNRAAVVALIMAAADALGGPKTPAAPKRAKAEKPAAKPKAEKPAKAAKGAKASK